MKKRMFILLKGAMRVFSVFVAAAMPFSTMTAYAANNLMPGVSDEMTKYTYWTDMQVDSDEVLLSEKQIDEFNKRILKEKSTNMYDLKKLPASFDGIEYAGKLRLGVETETKGFVGSYYDSEGNIIDEAYFTDVIENCENPDATAIQEVRYGIAVNRTNLLAYPTEKAILDDPTDWDFDYLFLDAVRVNEPVMIYSVSADKNYYYAHTACCSGWIPAKDVALCESRSQWLSAWNFSGKDTLVVYGSRVSTEESRTNSNVSGRRLTMGTKLQIVRNRKSGSIVSNRSIYNNYVVYLPVRGEDGGYGRELALISQHKSVSEGYLPLTKKNIAKVAFMKLGDIYGWGGMLGSNDCAGYVRDVYLCFGLNIARNTTWQSAMPLKKYNVAKYSNEEKKELLEELPLGTILFFPGHEMLYLGSWDDKYYVIDSVSSIMQPGTNKVQRVRGVIINTLDIKRRNGKTWMNELDTFIVPYEKK